MKHTYLLAGLMLLPLCGCSGDDAGNVDAAKAAVKAAPKTSADLPKDMPPEARAAAESAMNRGKAQQEYMDKQAEAMKKARAAGGS